MATPQYMSAADYAKLPSSIAAEKNAFDYQAANPNTSSSRPQAWDKNSAAYNPAAWIPGASMGAGGQMTYAPIAGTQTAAGTNPNASTTAAIFDGSNGTAKGYRTATGKIVYGDGDASERAEVMRLIGGGSGNTLPSALAGSATYPGAAAPSPQGATYQYNIGIPGAEKPVTNGYQVGNGLMEGYKPNYQAVPQTAVSSQTMDPATGQASTTGQNIGFSGNGNMPGQYSILPAGEFAPNAPQAYTPPTSAAPANAPMDTAAIQKYAADQIAAKLAAATNSANQARTSAEGDATQSTGLLDNQLAQAIARLKASAQQAQAGVQTGYDRANALTKDNRTLSDASFQRNTNPFSGATDYKSALIGREREISDRQGLEDYNSRLGSINQDAMNQQGAVEQDISASKAGIQQGLNNLKNKITTDLQNLETSTGAERERLIREITNDERQYALMLRGEDRQDVMTNATLAQNQFIRDMETFKTNYNVGQDAKEFDYKVGRDVKTDFNSDREYNYGVGQDKITNDRNAANDALVLRNQHLNEAANLSSKYGVDVQPKDDYQLMLDQVAGLPTVAQQTAAQQRITSQKTEAWKIVEFLGAVPEAYAELLGVPAGTQTQKAKEFAADVAYKENTTKINQQKADAATTKANKPASSGTSSSQHNQEQNRLIQIWHSQGSAPAGIDGVVPGTPYTGQVKPEQTTKPDSKVSTALASEARQKISGGTGVNNASAKRYVEAIKDQLSDVDYRAIIKWVDDQYGS